MRVCAGQPADAGAGLERPDLAGHGDRLGERCGQAVGQLRGVEGPAAGAQLVLFTF